MNVQECGSWNAYAPVVWMVTVHARGGPLWDLKVRGFCRRDNLLAASQSNHCTTVYGEVATVGLKSIQRSCYSDGQNTTATSSATVKTVFTVLFCDTQGCQVWTLLFYSV